MTAQGRQLEAQHAVMRVLAESDTVSGALEALLPAICEGTGWDVGAAWRIDERAGVLRCEAFWHAPTVHVPNFRALTVNYVFPPGVGLPGRVWSTRTAHRISDVVLDPNFPRAPIARGDGLHGAFGLPIRIGDEIFGVLEFFACDVRTLSDELLRTMDTIGSQIGLFVHRAQVQEAVRNSERRLKMLLGCTNGIVFEFDRDGRYVNVWTNNDALLVRPRSELLGRTITEILGERAAAPFMDRVARVFATREPETFEYSLEVKAGTSWFLGDSFVAPAESAGLPSVIFHVRDNTERKRAELDLTERGRLAAFTADVALGLVNEDRAPNMLQTCSEKIVSHLGAAFARIWTLSPDGKVLELRASAGQYTHLDGPHARVPMGKYKIGLIASEKKPHWTNTIGTDARVSDPEWAHREGMISFAGYPLIVGGRLVGVMAMFSRKETTEATYQALGSAAHSIGLAMEHEQARVALGHQADEQARLHEQLQTLSRKLLMVQESERRYLARELHDELAQSLTGLKLILETASRLPHEASVARVGEALKLVNQMARDVRAMSLNLRPAILNEGLLPALVAYLEQYAAQARDVARSFASDRLPEVRFEHTGIDGRALGPEIEIAAYRIVQEGLTNATRHAAARDVTVRLRGEPHTLHVHVEDSGAGFDAAAALAVATTGGLVGMRERSILLGGQLHIDSAPGRGTRIHAELPLLPTGEPSLTTEPSDDT